MEAHNRLLPDWFTKIRPGEVLLPRFQRHEAWGHPGTAALLESVLGGLPAEATRSCSVGRRLPLTVNGVFKRGLAGSNVRCT